MDEKFKSENIQKEEFSVFVLYFESNQGRLQVICRPHIYSDILQNAPFRGQIFQKFLHLRRLGCIDPPADVPEATQPTPLLFENIQRR